MKKLTIYDLISMKRSGSKIVMLAAYDYPTAAMVDKAGIDLILVGDSVGMVVLGYNNPLPVTMDEMIYHSKAVVRGAKRALVVGDLPFMSYHVNVEDTIRNAGRFVKEAGVDAVKLEGGAEVAHKIEALVEVGIPVQGHIGLQPQRAFMSGGFKIQGKDAETAKKILKDALAIEKAGAFSVLLEFVAAEVSQRISNELKIPAIGIGSGPYCDGQSLVLQDLLGINENPPPFAKKYANLSQTMNTALGEYVREVREGAFPREENTIHMDREESKKFKDLPRE